MTDREAQIEALYTCELPSEKIVRQVVKFGFISQIRVDEFAYRLFMQLNLKKTGIRLSSSKKEN